MHVVKSDEWEGQVKSHNLEITPSDRTPSQSTRVPEGLSLHFFQYANTQEICPIASLPPPNDTTWLPVFS